MSNKKKVHLNKVSFEAHGTTIVDPTSRRQEGDHGIGTSRRKTDARAKSTGRALYADDITLPGMLHCKLKRSTKMHAKILAVHLDDALALKGVHAIVTGEDMPKKYGIIPWTKDERALCKDKVRYIGDAVAAVAAENEEVANAALRLIRVDYEDFTPVPDVATAKASGDDERSKVNEKAKRGNVSKAVSLSFGDVDGELKNADVVKDAEYFFQGTTHAAIEPQCAIGDWDGKRLTVTSSTQVPHYLHRDLAEILEVDSAKIRVVQPVIGGAFGGKSEPFDLEFCVAKLSMKTGRPVKCLYTREEVFLAHRGRHPMQMHFRTGAKKDGTLVAVKSDIDIDGGAYASFGMITAFYAGQILMGPTGAKTYAFNATRYYTNKPACGPKRGHGSVQPRFAFECQLDEVAEELGRDPIDLRLQNFVGEHTDTVNGQHIGSMGFAACLKSVRERSGWDNKYKKMPRGRGIGVACSMYISGTNYPIYPNEMPQSAVQVALDRSGRVTLFSGASDIGQGSDTVLATIACEELGVLSDDVIIVSSDTDLTPVDLGAYSSRVTLMMGHAAQEACRLMREKVQIAVCAYWRGDEKSKGCAGECEPDQVLFGHGKVWFAGNTDLTMSTKEAFVVAESHHGNLATSGDYRTQDRGGEYRGGTIGSSPAYSCTVHVAEVEVCEETGHIAIDKIWVAHDCGRALNPVLVEGQIEGSTYMGASEVALENMLYGDDAPHAGRQVRSGMLVGPSLLGYRIPTTLDTPALDVDIVEQKDPNGPYGAKEAGEGPLHSAIPAVANAIADAVNIRLRTLPFTPGRVLSALEEQAAQEQAAQEQAALEQSERLENNIANVDSDEKGA
ncbi:MAG: molybdopterin-dependent oxidoreductase [Deltaproteobacteria bacterium]|nr:molybdopterin-dependent oxidoreductase [Deltaproteobacteria bacterium]